MSTENNEPVKTILCHKKAIDYIKTTYGTELSEIELRRFINDNNLTVLRENGKLNVIQEEIDTVFQTNS